MKKAIFPLFLLLTLFGCRQTPEYKTRIIYVANGATSGTPPVDEKLYDNYDTFTIMGPGSLKKEGFQFLEWECPSGIPMKPGDQSEPLSPDFQCFKYEKLYFFAIWVPTSYDVTFMAEDFKITQERSHGYTINAPAPPKRSGIFSGWYQDQKFTMGWNIDDPVVENMTLYGRWIPEDSEYLFNADNPNELRTIQRPISSEEILPEQFLGTPITALDSYLFAKNLNIHKATIPGSISKLGKGLFFQCENLKTVKLPKTLKSLPKSIFRESGLQTIDLPNSLKTIEANAFSDSKINSLILPDTLSEIGQNAFRATSLKKMKLPERISALPRRTFADCSDLTAVTSAGTIEYLGAWAFDECSALTTLPDLSEISRVHDGTFYRCTKLHTVNLPNQVSYIGTCAFNGCTSLKDFKFPKSLTTIEAGAFSGCTSLEKIDLPDTLRVLGSEAFSGCTALTEAALPNGVTIVADSLFVYSGLESLSLGSRVSKIEPFLGKSSGASLSTLTIKTETPPAFNPAEITIEEIRVPAEAVAAYKAHPDWARFATQISAIEE